MAKVLFSASEDEILVEMIAKFSCLYDLASELYKNQVIKDNAWKEVAEAVSRTVDDCKKRWRNIKDTHSKRQKKGASTGLSASSKPKKWVLTDVLSFLDQANYKRKTISNVETSNEPTPEIDDEDAEDDQVQENESPNDETENISSGKNTSSTAINTPKETPSLKGPSVLSSTKRPRRTDKLVGLLEHRRNERLEMFKNLSQNQEDHVDLFFKSLAKSVKKLKPELIQEAKMKALGMVCDLERRNSLSHHVQGASVGANSYVPSRSNITTYVPSPAGSSAEYFSDPPYNSV